ncbi:MAG TPA: hypothetical protein VEA37_05450 [Flavobacterium sp.]|nr:hypothetical protein [Flavobacterium sp.]
MKKYKSYGEKKTAMRNGSYGGNSPFYNNIPEYQYLKPLASYPHLRDMRPTEKPGIVNGWDNTMNRPIIVKRRYQDTSNIANQELPLIP